MVKAVLILTNVATRAVVFGLAVPSYSPGFSENFRRVTKLGRQMVWRRSRADKLRHSSGGGDQGKIDVAGLANSVKQGSSLYD